MGDHRVRSEAAESASMLDENDRMRPVVLPADRGPVHLQQVIRTLARLERTDALKLPELLIEAESRISSETTVLAIVQRCDEQGIAALLGLSRRGRAVAVIVNTYAVTDYAMIAGPFISLNIPVFHLADIDSVTNVCRSFALRG